MRRPVKAAAALAAVVLALVAAVIIGVGRPGIPEGPPPPAAPHEPTPTTRTATDAGCDKIAAEIAKQQAEDRKGTEAGEPIATLRAYAVPDECDDEMRARGLGED